MDVRQVDLEPKGLNGMSSILEGAYFDRFTALMRQTASRLNGQKVWNINSTAEGGGVAEMLGTLLPYCAELGWDIRWAVMFGDDTFFELTKTLHNALHGADLENGALEDGARDVYQATTDANVEQFKSLISPGDVVMIHDPQAAGLIAPLLEHGARVSWQCHIGTDDAKSSTHAAWDFLRSYVADADRYVFTRETYLWDGLDKERLRIIPPSIDALSPKNMPLADKTVLDVLRVSGFLSGDRPASAEFDRPDGGTGVVRRPVDRVGGKLAIPDSARTVLQVSRWDRLKDPIGCIHMFVDHLADLDDVHLVHAGPSTENVDDDPEGAEVLDECAELWKSLPADLQQRVHLISVPMEDIEENAVIVNALQRHADIVVQKSIQEGFGLTVSEAMWKHKPVVASHVGGIQDQIEDGKSGILVDDPADVAAFGSAVRKVLSDEATANRLGDEAHRRVCDNFLGPRQLMQYAQLVDELVT